MLLSKLESERGGLLFAFLFVILFLASFWLILATLVSSETQLQVHYVHQEKTFYAAESAIELAMAEINNGGDGNLSNIDIDGIVVNTTNQGDSMLTAVAVSPHGKKVVRMNIESIQTSLPEPFYFASSSFAPSSKADEFKFEGKHSSYISGKIYSQAEDEFELESPLVIDSDNTTLYVPYGTEVDNETGHSLNVERYFSNDPPLEYPVLDTQYYDDYINNAGGYSAYATHKISSDLDLATLPDGVLYSGNEKLEIKNGVSITGPGVIVSPKEIKLKKNVTIGPNVHIIAGKELKLDENVTVNGMGSVLYSSKKIEIAKKYTTVQGSVISMGEMKLDSDANFSKRSSITGLVYCGPDNKLKLKHFNIYGSVVAWRFDGDKIHCAHVEFNDNYLPPTVPPGFSSAASDTVLAVSGSWRNMVGE